MLDELRVKEGKSSKLILVKVHHHGSTASIFYGISIAKSGAMVLILNIDKVLLKKLFPTMNV